MDSWDQNPKVSIDRGRLMSNGISLLKSKKRIRKKLAIVLMNFVLFRRDCKSLILMKTGNG